MLDQLFSDCVSWSVLHKALSFVLGILFHLRLMNITKVTILFPIFFTFLAEAQGLYMTGSTLFTE
jgi:hypothetical protein